jgi:hypothetical protein
MLPRRLMWSMPDPETGPAAPHALEPCPRCTALSGKQTLLTSMTRYYACGQCGCAWHKLRVDERPQVSVI